MSHSRNVLTQKVKKKSKGGQRQGDAFVIHVSLTQTGEKFILKKVDYDMTVAQLKSDLEFATGIPISIQRISYLDEGELQDNTDLKSNDLVPGGTVRLKVWHMYQELLEAVTSNDIDWVFRIGVTSTSDYHTPATDYMTKDSRTEWLGERAFIALCLASHRGHEELVVKLIEHGADVNRQTATGKTPLHLASAVGNEKMVNTLLQHGADINAEDQDGNTALSVSERFGHQACSRNLFQFKWKQRAKKVKPSKNVPLFAHQHFDSNYPVWKRGSSAQIYLSNILKPGEFEGTSLGAPRSGRHPSLVHKQLRDATFFRDSSSMSNGQQDCLSPTDSGLLALTEKQKIMTTLKKPLTYQEWLDKRTEMEKKTALENRKQLEEKTTENSREEDISCEYSEDPDNDGWLEYADQEQIDKSTQHTLPTRCHSTAKTATAGYTPLSIHHDGALRVYLRSLGKSSSGVSYEEWLDEKEMEINMLVQQKNVNIS